MEEEIVDEIKDVDVVDLALGEREEKVKLTRKGKRERRLKNRYFFENDIKYRGPFSYRYLRLIAWFSIAVTQALMLNAISGTILPAPMIGSGWELALTFISVLSVPLFIIATFSTILNKSKSIKSVIIFYAFAYFGIAFALVFVYYRYVDSLLSKMGVASDTIRNVGISLGGKAEINVFADLLALSIFYFFMMYVPKNHFKGNKIKIFRLLSIIPLLFALASYLVKSLAIYGSYTIPFGLAPFLTTKPPLIYVLFIILVFWFKYRERQYIKLGGTKAGFKKYEESNRNSLSFSIFICIVCAVISILDSIIYLVPLFNENWEVLLFVDAFDFGECAGLIFAIPVLMLFSYSRKHKPSNLDIVVVLIGLGMIGITYVEMLYEMVFAIINASAEEAVMLLGVI